MLARLSLPGIICLILLTQGWLCALAGAVLLSLTAARRPPAPTEPSTNGTTNKRMGTSEADIRLFVPDSWMAAPDSWMAARFLFSIALALSGLSLLAGAVPGWEAWTAALGAPGLGGAGMGLCLLAGVLHRQAGRSRGRTLFDVALAWLAVAAGAWALWRILAG